MSTKAASALSGILTFLTLVLAFFPYMLLGMGIIGGANQYTLGYVILALITVVLSIFIARWIGSRFANAAVFPARLSFAKAAGTIFVSVIAAFAIFVVAIAVWVMVFLAIYYPSSR